MEARKRANIVHTLFLKLFGETDFRLTMSAPSRYTWRIVSRTVLVELTTTDSSAGGTVDSLMSESSTNTLPSQQQIPEEVAIEIRRLAHDLSNSLEIIVQTSYLLSMSELKEPASSWLRMLDSGVQKALDLNLELREYVKKNTPL
jgi:hypothetical protein